MAHETEAAAAASGYRFVDDDGTFVLEHPERTSYLYFPLANAAGMMSSVTPLLHGDAKISQNAFLLEPVSAEDLHNRRSARNFWLFDQATGGAWSATGNSARQTAARFLDDDTEAVSLEAGLLWHRVTRTSERFGVTAEIVSFVPVSSDRVELMRVSITNVSAETRTFTPTAAVPIYGRSAESVRDHRHVTSLLHRIGTTRHGVVVQPSMCFDERGHTVNDVRYSVLGAEGAGGAPPVGFFPVALDFVGEGGTYDWPQAVVTNAAPAAAATDDATFAGYEAVGALRFADLTLAPGESAVYIIALAIQEPGDADIERMLNGAAFAEALAENRRYWAAKTGVVRFASGDPDFDRWMRWVTVQPILRRIYGCSFLPHHDYGRGGRGWRDLWQDCLALLVMDPADVRRLLYNNYAGVRMDGSNATIIGAQAGEFIADRNNIARVWMDHGAWPFLTTKLYLDQSGDLTFLQEQQTYFKDRQAGRSTTPDDAWTPEYGSRQRTAGGEIYSGTLLEHILIQNAVPFFNVGAHNNIRLEGADWNDALDMARTNGESVAFTSFYAWNLREIAGIVREMASRLTQDQVEIAEEMLPLFDSLTDPLDYDSISAKRALLDRYYRRCRHDVSGKKVHVDAVRLARDLERKADWLVNHVRRNEWIESASGHAWFNGYYDDHGQSVEGDFPSGVRMTLTGQVFAVMGGVATDDQVAQIHAAVLANLKDDRIGGYRLNSDFHEVKLDLGRGFGFAFGHKENGAVFSHMAVMYANALYRRGFAREGWDVLSSLYDLASDFPNARIYPGLPEYFDARRRGMYHYLTGSASWLLLTLLTEVYGVRGHFGDLELAPKLLASQFDAAGEASVHTRFADVDLDVVYRNRDGCEPDAYRVAGVLADGKAVPVTYQGDDASARIDRALLRASASSGRLRLEVELRRR